jgi:hypothetical protein
VAEVKAVWCVACRSLAACPLEQLLPDLPWSKTLDGVGENSGIDDQVSAVQDRGTPNYTGG